MNGDFMNVNQINSLVLAYLGDAIYEKHIRLFLIKKGINNVNELQKESIKYVSAKSQAYLLDFLIKKDFLTEEEINVVKRARNAKVLSRPKRVDILTYKHATGLEALIGYLYVTDKQERINDILAVVIANADANNRGNVKNQ